METKKLDNIFKIVVFCLFVGWFCFAAVLTVRHVAFVRTAYKLFYGKTEDEKLKIVAADIYETIAVCKENTDVNAKILIIDSPDYKNKFRLDYYLYPRRMYWKEEGRVNDMVAYCMEKGIDYYLVYDKTGRPILRKVI